MFQTSNLEGVELERVHDFRYLGSIKSDSGHCTKDITSRIAMAKTKTIDLKNIWKDKDLSNKIKITNFKNHSLEHNVVWSGRMDHKKSRQTKN